MSIRENYKIKIIDECIFIKLNNKESSVCVLDKSDMHIIDCFDSINIHRNRVCVARSIETSFSHLHENLALHRVVMCCTKQYSRGFNKLVDHINRDYLDNRKSNLRFADKSQNAANSKSNSKSGFKGVILEKRNLTKRFTAYSKKDGSTSNINLGRYETAKEAAIAFDDYQWNKYGEFAYLNFPERYKNNNGIVIERPYFG